MYQDGNINTKKDGRLKELDQKQKQYLKERNELELSLFTSVEEYIKVFKVFEGKLHAEEHGWWRRWELNPCPKALFSTMYKHS